MNAGTTEIHDAGSSGDPEQPSNEILCHIASFCRIEQALRELSAEFKEVADGTEAETASKIDAEIERAVAYVRKNPSCIKQSADKLRLYFNSCQDKVEANSEIKEKYSTMQKNDSFFTDVDKLTLWPVQIESEDLIDDNDRALLIDELKSACAKLYEDLTKATTLKEYHGWYETQTLSWLQKKLDLTNSIFHRIIDLYKEQSPVSVVTKEKVKLILDFYNGEVLDASDSENVAGAYSCFISLFASTLS